MTKTFYEFFAGGGMARAGLGADWKCLFANDFCKKKAAAYAENWGDHHLVVRDVNRSGSVTFLATQISLGLRFLAKTCHWRAVVPAFAVSAAGRFGGSGR